MANIRYGKWGCWIQPVGVLLSLFALITAQQPGFLSIICGGKTNYTDENNITWVPDADYMHVGATADIGNVTEQARGSPLNSLRFFPRPLDKSCYTLPVPSNVPYLSLEITVDSNKITLRDNNRGYDERIIATSGTVMSVCLIRTSESDDPFISGIELRPLRDGMYIQATPGTMLKLITRIDGGGISSTLRYPQDKFDRIWTSDISIPSNNVNLFRSVSTGELVSINNTEDLPPTAVMQTAWVVNSSYSDGVYFSLGSSVGSKSLLLLYFAEIETLNISTSRSFCVSINGDSMDQIVTPIKYSTEEWQFIANHSFFNFGLSKAPNSTR